ncbi:MAG: lamin tail domain-containing protein, partial [Verrucomicrobiota bacterium]
MDGDIIVLSASNLPPGATFSTVTNAGGVTNVFNWPSAAPTGSYMVSFYAADTNGVVSETITINVVTSPGPALIWFNEFHYQNDGVTRDEGVEVAGRAGTVLSNFMVVAYRQDGTPYDTLTLSGVIDDEACGFGAVWFDIPGLQNGPSDGFALVRVLDSAVFQFLSYEGPLVGTAGAAAGMTSEVVNVQEAFDTPLGDSIQLTGTGADYLDFLWAGPTNNTRGTLNVMNGQFITNCTDYVPIIRPIGSQRVTVSNNLSFTVIADEQITNMPDTITLSALSLPPGSTFPTVMNVASATSVFNWVNAAPLGVYTAVFQAADNDGSNIVSVIITVGQDISVVISEIHYDPSASSSDQDGEWFEIFNRSTNALDLNGW